MRAPRVLILAALVPFACADGAGADGGDGIDTRRPGQDASFPKDAMAGLDAFMATDAAPGMDANNTDASGMDANSGGDANGMDADAMDAAMDAATGMDATSPDTNVMDAGPVGCTYPAGAVEPMTLNEVITPYSWNAALTIPDSQARTIDLQEIYCNNDADQDWSVDFILFASLPFW